MKICGRFQFCFSHKFLLRASFRRSHARPRQQAADLTMSASLPQSGRVAHDRENGFTAQFRTKLREERGKKNPPYKVNNNNKSELSQLSIQYT